MVCVHKHKLAASVVTSTMIHGLQGGVGRHGYEARGVDNAWRTGGVRVSGFGFRVRGLGFAV